VIDTDSEAWLRLALIPGLGDASIRTLLRAFGSPDAVLSAPPGRWRGVVGAAQVDALRTGAPPEHLTTARDWLATSDHHLIALGDPRYPARLLEIADPPTLLFARGRLELLQAPALAIVGSRHASAQGIETATAFARALADAGLVIVSGLALGIDGAAHRGALAGVARSIAVLGTGPDRVYPARHRDLAHALAADGLLLSEFAPGVGVLAAHFVRRNRVISGLSRGVLVVEAALRSGSLTTARSAVEQGREVFAIPGSIHSPLARGCHALIKQGAKLVESADDVLEELGLAVTPRGSRRAGASRRRETPTAHPDDPVLRALGHDPCDIDTLARLLALELDGAVASLPGARWQALRRG
jgi:DNA processing protein